MTTEQWLLEYHAIKRREQREAELVQHVFNAAYKAGRALLISLLGLNLLPRHPPQAGGSDGGDGSDGSDDEAPPFVPLTFLAGRPELMKPYLEELDRSEEATAAASDEEFERTSAELARRLAQGDLGDMEPLYGVPDEVAGADRGALLSELKAAGVQVEGEGEGDVVEIEIPEGDASR